MKRARATALLAAVAMWSPVVAPAAPGERQDARPRNALDSAPYQTDEAWLDSVVDQEDKSTGDVDQYHRQVRDAARDFATGRIGREEYWEAVQDARVLLEPDDGVKSERLSGPYSNWEAYDDLAYTSDEHGTYDAGQDWETTDTGWNGWYEFEEIRPPQRRRQ